VHCKTLGGILLLAFSLLVAPFATEAQPPAHIPKVGWLEGGVRADKAHLHAAFLQGLHELGYVEGQHFVLVQRDAEGQLDRLPALAVELVRLPVDVIVTTAGVPATRAAMQATTTVPIVITEAGDPVGTGLVASLARPGGNVTGLSSTSPDLVSRRLELLKEITPMMTRVAVLYYPSFPATRVGLHLAQAAAPALGLTILPIEVRTADELDNQLTTILRLGADALLTPGDPFTAAHLRHILHFAATHRLPTMCGGTEYAASGCLIAYGASLVAQYRRAAYYVDKILKGTKPADLPVEQAMSFELVINLKTAEALGLTIPPTLRFQADKVLQ
jgi:putative ABC transport system substrate-binding protein